MALPFLPAQHIQSMFARKASLAPPNGEMCELINVNRTSSVCFSLLDCSIFLAVSTIIEVRVILVRFRLLCQSFITTAYVLFLASVHRAFLVDIIILTFIVETIYYANVMLNID